MVQLLGWRRTMRCWSDWIMDEDVGRDAQTEKSLSPLDPLLCAIQSSKAVAYLVQGNYEDGARWAVKGARAPQAHSAMLTTAVAACQLVGDHDGARYRSEVLRERWPDASIQQYFATLPYTEPGIRKLLSEALAAAGLPESSR